MFQLFKMPMKTPLFILLGLISLIFTSCDLNSESNSQPDIEFLQNPVANGTDTLVATYQEAGIFLLDTLTVGDTVSFRIYITGYSNNLKEYYMIESADSVSEILLPSRSSMDSIFLSTSNYATGKFMMDGTSTALYMPFKYVARKASLEAKITFRVVSDANFENNSNSFVLKTPIVAAPVSAN